MFHRLAPGLRSGHWNHDGKLAVLTLDFVDVESPVVLTLLGDNVPAAMNGQHFTVFGYRQPPADEPEAEGIAAYAANLAAHPSGWITRAELDESGRAVELQWRDETFTTVGNVRFAFTNPR